MRDQGLLIATSLVAVLAAACVSPQDQRAEIADELSSAGLPAPGPGLPPNTVIVPLPNFAHQSRTVEIPNEVGFLHGEILGHGSEAIVIINGGPGLDSVFVTRLQHGLADRLPGRLIVRYDQRGMGSSTPTTAAQNTIAGNVEDVEAIRRFLRVRKLHLVGQSFGGFVAGAYASTHPDNVASIAFIDPLPPLPADSEFTTKGFDAINAHYSDLLDAGILQPLQDDDSDAVGWNRVVGVYFADPLRIPLEITTPAADRNLTVGDAVDADYQANGAPLVANLGNLRLPVLVIGGGSSGFGPTFAQGAAAALAASNPTVVVIPGAGHIAWIDKPAQTLGALQRFFDDCARPR